MIVAMQEPPKPPSWTFDQSTPTPNHVGPARVVPGAPGSAIWGHAPFRPAIPYRTPVWLYVVVAIIFAGVVVLQRPVPADPLEIAQLKSGDLVRRESFSIETLLGKMLLFIRGGNPSPPSTPPGSPAASQDPALTILESLEEQAKASEYAQDKFRAAVFVGEFKDLALMRTRFDELAPTLSPTSDLHKDIETVKALYDEAEHRADRTRAASSSPPAPPSEADVAALIDRHGWVGKLAATAPKTWGGSSSLRTTAPPAPAPATPPVDAAAASAPSAPATAATPIAASLAGFRDQSANDGVAVVVIFIVFGLLILFAFLAGIVLLIVGFVLASAGRLARWNTPWRDDFAELEPQLHNGRVWLETFGLFVAGFLLLLGLRAVIPYQQLGLSPIWFVLLSQWLLVVTLFWPVVRGMPWLMFRALVGWHRGRGFLREVSFGFLAYLAAVPVYIFVAFLVVLVMLIYQTLTGSKPVPPGADKIIDLASGSPLQLAMVFLLATVWAPFVEETVFRGCLHRFVRGKLGAAAAIIITAIAFAAMHGYMFQQLLLIGVLGAVFSFMREQRGSLIPSMTAHFIHNSVVFTLISLIVGFGSDVN